MILTVFTKARRAQNDEDFETWVNGEVTPTLNLFDNTSETRSTVLIFEATRVEDTRLYEDYSPTVATYWGTGGARVPYVVPTDHVKVRRLTPIDCELLQGFPEDWTSQRYDFRKDKLVDQADSTRYRQIGNAVAVPVVDWIIGRLIQADDDD